MIRQFWDFMLALPPRPDNGQKVDNVRSANAEKPQPPFDGFEEHYKQKPERSRICNMRWSNTTVMLGETDFIRCRFFRCRLIDDGPFSMEKCFVEDCSIRTKNWK